MPTPAHVTERARSLRYAFGTVKYNSVSKQIGLRRVRRIIRIAVLDPAHALELMPDAEACLLEAKAVDSLRKNLGLN